MIVTTMREVGIRQLQQNLHQQLKNLPFVVTIRGKREFVVTKYVENAENVTTEKPKKPSIISKFMTNKESIPFD